ncbi:GtrA family protein [Pseudonocardia sp.]|uniref:GtrA family protein n=1 Tax=Pseudonocardia sp. TaxID=60912 RepID=UPI00261441C1|nr:GtrA family protein [Pseudonocardia sp.]
MTDLRPRTRTAADRFAGLCARIARPLPAWVAPSFLGFCLINGFTFGVDLVLLTIMYGLLGWPSPVAVTLGYAVAFGLSFVLNRWLNFRSHAPVGPQVGRYVVAVVVNYLAFILGVGSGLVALGVQYHVSRLVAGACEGVFMYGVLRWVVFPAPPAAAGAAGTPARPRRRRMPRPWT